MSITQANIDEIMKRQSSLEARKQWFAQHVDSILKDLPKHTRPLDSAR